jgi:hypothetical protein
VTLETEGANVRPDQEKTVGRPVGDVTDAASFCLDGQMLENPGASFFRMALKTRVHVELIPLFKACSGPRSMRSMAIRTFYRPLDDSMVGGEVKLGLNVLMARGTEVRLRTFQELLGHRGSVNLMAIIAADGS